MPFDPKLLAAIFAALISLSGNAYYLYSCFKKGIQPHGYTWLIWSITTLVAFVSQVEGGAGFALVFTGVMLINSVSISLVGLIRNREDITRHDTVILAICLLAVALLPLSETALYSLLIVTLVDVAGYFPSVRKAWGKPFNESAFCFFVYFITNTLALAALDSYNILTVTYPLAVALTSIGFSVMILCRRLCIKKEVEI